MQKNLNCPSVLLCFLWFCFVGSDQCKNGLQWLHGVLCQPIFNLYRKLGIVTKIWKQTCLVCRRYQDIRPTGGGEMCRGHQGAGAISRCSLSLNDRSPISLAPPFPGRWWSLHCHAELLGGQREGGHEKGSLSIRNLGLMTLKNWLQLIQGFLKASELNNRYILPIFFLL